MGGKQVFTLPLLWQEAGDEIRGLQVLEKMNNISCGGRCAVGSGGKSVGKCFLFLPSDQPRSCGDLGMNASAAWGTHLEPLICSARRVASSELLSDVARAGNCALWCTQHSSSPLPAELRGQRVLQAILRMARPQTTCMTD